MISQTINNKSKIYFNGSKWNIKKYGTIEIIAKLNRRNYYLCKFDDGTIVEARSSNIKAGVVKNPNYPIIYNMGYIGEGKWKSRINNFFYLILQLFQ